MGKEEETCFLGYTFYEVFLQVVMDFGIVFLK
jgi:hypothetical protein